MGGFLAGPLSCANWNLEMLVFVERGKREDSEKNPRSMARTNKKPRENEGTERDIQGVGWDMSIPLKLF